VRRLIPFTILAVLVVASLVTLRLSYEQSSTHGSSVLIVTGCSTKVTARPTKYVITCADANTLLTSLHWTDWGEATAYATGQARYNDCTPTCVSGHWRDEPVTVWAWRIRDHRYTRLASSDPRVLGEITVRPYPS
jgi:hypothetical protein